MTKNSFHTLSTFKHYILRNIVCSYYIKTQEYLDVLNALWLENLIWGYKVLNNSVKLYFRVYCNKVIIKVIRFYQKYIKVVQLKKYTHFHPQSLFFLKTIWGIKSHNYCIEHNIGGLLLIKIDS
jgi:hypothetical protein